MHSIIPHQHANDVEDIDQSQSFEEADSFLDYVKLLFLTDLGEGHMETFDQGEQFDFASEFQMATSPEVYPFACLATLDDLSCTEYHDLNKYRDDIPIIRQYFLSHIDFRGPPVLI